MRTKPEFSILTKSELVADMRAMLDRADSERRELTADEQRRYDTLEAELEARQQQPSMRVQLYDDPSGYSVPRVDSHGHETFSYLDRATGERVRPVSHGESIRDCRRRQPNDDGVSFGELCAGLLSNRWEGRQRELAAVQTSNDTSGGVLQVPTSVSQRVIDLARARMVMDRAGARTIDLPAAAESKFARVTPDPVAYWRREGTAITSSAPVFDAIIMRPKTLGMLVGVTVEMLEDVPNIGRVLEDITANAMALALDQAVLRGDGSPGAEPIGILNNEDVQSTSMGAAWTYDDLIDYQKLVWDQNGPERPTAFIVSPATMASAAKRKDGNSLWLDAPPVFRDVPWLVSTTIPDNLGAGSATEIYQGDFTRVLIGIRTQLTVEMLPAGTATDASGNTENATSELKRWLRVYLRADTHIEQPKHIHVATNVTQ